MISVKYYHDKRSGNENHPLKIAVSFNRKVTYFQTGVRLREDQWSGSEVVNHRNAREFNRAIDRLRISIEDAVAKIQADGVRLTDIGDLKNRIEDVINPDKKWRRQEKNLFLARLKAFADSRPAEGTRRIYRGTVSRISAFDPKAGRLRFEDINKEWLAGFDAFLAKTSPSANARNIHLRNIRAVFNEAIDDEITTSYPFRRFKIRSVETRKRSFPVEVLREIFNFDGLDAWETKYMDFFKLSFMLIGINVVDLCRLTGIVDGRVNYNRAKTHRLYSIKIEPEAMEIIERHRGGKFLLDYMDTYSDYRSFYMNLCEGLNSIKRKLGLDELTTYWARHSWATIARSLKISKDDIALALGHGQKTVTDIYIDEDLAVVDEANRRVLDWVLYGRGLGGQPLSPASSARRS